jgi:hypothetical protein
MNAGEVVVLKKLTTDDFLFIRRTGEIWEKKAFLEHCCPRQARPVAGPAENEHVGGTSVGDLGGGLRFGLSWPVQVIPMPG